MDGTLIRDVTQGYFKEGVKPTSELFLLYLPSQQLHPLLPGSCQSTFSDPNETFNMDKKKFNLYTLYAEIYR